MKIFKSHINIIYIFLFMFLILIFISFLTIFSIVDNACAYSNANDKLYGETLNSRSMPLSDCPNITAKYACLMNKNGKIIYERDSYEKAQIASLTKIMTAIVAMENSDLNDTLEVSEKAVSVGESSAGLWKGDILDMKTALVCMLVPSGNDSAQAISEKVGSLAIANEDYRICLSNDDDEVIYEKDPEKAFVMLMNNKAKEIGCNNTNFTNPHGLADDEYADNNQYCCALDICKITHYAMKKDLFRDIVGGGDVFITVNRNGNNIPLRLSSTDVLLSTFDGCIGVKTGNTEIGGPCFSGAYRDETGDEIYTIVLKSDDETQRFIDTQNLFNWYIKNKVTLDLTNTNVHETIITEDGTSKSVGVVAYLAHNDWVDSSFPVTIKDDEKLISVLTCAGNIHIKIDPKSVSGDFKAGDKAGELILLQHNSEIARLDLISIYDNPAPNVFQVIGVALDKFMKNISGQSTCAQTEIIANCDKVNKN